MSSAAPAPPRVPAPSAPPPPARGVETLSPRAFRTLLLAIAALAAMMAAEGVQSFAQMRERHYAVQARLQAVSPVPYGTTLPALHALVPAGGGVRMVVRSDSAASDASALCTLAAQSSDDSSLRWIAFSADVDPCVARAVGTRMLRAGSPVAAEMGRARWMVMDADGLARYSRPAVPALADVRRITALLTPATPAEAGR
ncbi:hypothetical protein [Longimicrobium sp.]|uniref:hypothetical protein n=1 Tax=Longimicrobium sp. TaxID=2029185 RepID=UPI003B3A29FA